MCPVWPEAMIYSCPSSCFPALPPLPIVQQSLDHSRSHQDPSVWYLLPRFASASVTGCCLNVCGCRLLCVWLQAAHTKILSPFLNVSCSSIQITMSGGMQIMWCCSLWNTQNESHTVGPDVLMFAWGVCLCPTWWIGVEAKMKDTAITNISLFNPETQLCPS